MTKNYAVITGASAGLGEMFAKQLAEQGYPLMLVARREERLRALAESLPTQCEVIVADLSKEAQCLQVYEQIKEKEISVFINNAGFGECGRFTETDLQKECDMIQVNIKAVHIFTKKILQKMQKENKGYLLNVASSAGLMPAGPYMSAYYATKAYVTSLTRGIAEELREKKSKVYVGCLCPGPVDTEFNQVANVEFALKSISAQKCVAYALQQMKKRKVVIIPGFDMKFCMTMGRFIPAAMYVKIAAHQQRRKMQR